MSVTAKFHERLRIIKQNSDLPGFRKPGRSMQNRQAVIEELFLSKMIPKYKH